MRRLVLFQLACIALATMPAAALDPLFEIKPWEQLSDRRVSRLGRSALRAGGDWVHAESAHFIAHAPSESRLGVVVRKSEYAYEELGRLLNLEPAPHKAQVFALANEKAWLKIKRRSGWREEGRSVLYGNEIFVLEGETDGSYKPDLFHEVAHFRLREAFGRRLPLWLEEGLASHLGWETTRSYHLFHGRVLSRTQPPVTDEHLLTVDEVVRLSTYPKDSEAVRAFCRQTEELVRLISRQLGPEQFPIAVHSLATSRASWRAVLKNEFKVTDEDIARIEEGIRTFAVEDADPAGPTAR